MLPVEYLRTKAYRSRAVDFYACTMRMDYATTSARANIYQSETSNVDVNAQEWGHGMVESNFSLKKEHI